MYFNLIKLVFIYNIYVKFLKQNLEVRVPRNYNNKSLNFKA